VRNYFLALLFLLTCPMLSALSAQILHPDEKTFNGHVLHRGALVYPQIAKAAQVSGTVVLQVEVNPEGKVTHVRVVSGPPMLIGAAVTSIQKTTYRPFLVHGKPVFATGTTKMNFDLGPGAQPSPVQAYLAEVRSHYALEPFLPNRGFVCAYSFEWQQIPALSQIPHNAPFWQYLQATTMQVAEKAPGLPKFSYRTPDSPALSAEQAMRAKRLIGGIGQFATGFYNTWFAFGSLGPSAPANAEMTSTAAGRIIKFHVSSAENTIQVDANMRVTRLLQKHLEQTMDERPQFTLTTKGLLYTGTDMQIEGAESTHVHYTVDYQQVGEYRLPKTVRLTVNEGPEYRLHFSDCTLDKIPPPPPGTVVVSVKPSPQ